MFPVDRLGRNQFTEKIAIKKSASPEQAVSTITTPQMIEERIRARAYELFEERGREEGHDWEDWFRAEKEVTGISKLAPPLHSSLLFYAWRRTQKRGSAVFNSLEEQIDKTEGDARSAGARAVRDVGLFVLSAILFAGLYLAIRLVD